MIVSYRDKDYELIEEARVTGSLLPNKNYHEVDIGEEYQFEMVAKAKDSNDNNFLIYWVFTAIKGEEISYEYLDYSQVSEVTVI